MSSMITYLPVCTIKPVVVAFDLVSYASSLVVLWSIFWLLEDLAERLAWFECRTNVESLSHVINPIQSTLHIWYDSKVYRTF